MGSEFSDRQISTDTCVTFSSNITNLTSGVVQGSVLGPLLFVLINNDIVALFTGGSCTCKLYADDLKPHAEVQADANYTT